MKFKILQRIKYTGTIIIMSAFVLFSCENYNKKDYKDNSPTSGKLKVYYEEGLEPHVKNQTATFESQYENVSVELYRSNETEAFQALYNDSCEAIVVTRLPDNIEKKAFASKDFYPKYTAVAKTGLAFITGTNTALNRLTTTEVKNLFLNGGTIKDSTGKEIKIQLLVDKNNSAVVHYLLDSVIRTKTFPAHCNVLTSAIEAINFTSSRPNTIAIIDYAWLSDVDDSLYKSNSNKIRFLAIGSNGTEYYYPDQSNFKLGLYPYTRTVYVMRKTGDFTLAKGFESFIAGPKGQLTFLKQGLLPARQGERMVNINTGPLEGDATPKIP